MNSKALRAVLLFVSVLSPLAAHAQNDVSLWLTNSDRSALFELQTPPLPFASAPATNQIIDVDSTKTYQTMDGFGFALTGGSAQLIMHMDPAKRADLLRELFGVDGNNLTVAPGTRMDAECAILRERYGAFRWPLIRKAVMACAMPND